MKRRRHHARPAAAPYVDKLECPSCRQRTVVGSRWWGLAVLTCAPCHLDWTPAEFEAATDIARRQVHELPEAGVRSPAGGGVI